jgi:glycosyltransferase involved in cell wall biosynthesis
MRFLLIHNAYQRRGGEDVLFETERNMILAHGHEVVEYTRHNDEISSYALPQMLTLPARTVWAWDSHEAVRRLCLEKKPDCAIIFNTLPLVSPAVVYACHEAGVPVIQHIQNYRLMCSSGTLYRDGDVCEECLDHGLWRGVLHGCYRGSRMGSAVVASQIAVHRAAQTWKRKVSGFIAPSIFIRDIAVRSGIPRNRIHIKPNCLQPDPGPRASWENFALYAGRLSPEKGVRVLVHAWMKLGAEIPLKIVGDGPLRGELEACVSSSQNCNVSFLGSRPRDEVLSLMKKTRLFVSPTECYEGFPMTTVEALACGAPIMASRLGAVKELLRENEIGFFFPPGDADALADKVRSVWNQTDSLRRVSDLARGEFELKYTGEQNHARLLEILGAIKSGERPKAEAPASEMCEEQTQGATANANSTIKS